MKKDFIEKYNERLKLKKKKGELMKEKNMEFKKMNSLQKMTWNWILIIYSNPYLMNIKVNLSPQLKKNS